MVTGCHNVLAVEELQGEIGRLPALILAWVFSLTPTTVRAAILPPPPKTNRSSHFLSGRRNERQDSDAHNPKLRSGFKF